MLDLKKFRGLLQSSNAQNIHVTHSFPARVECGRHVSLDSEKILAFLLLQCVQHRAIFDRATQRAYNIRYFVIFSFSAIVNSVYMGICSVFDTVTKRDFEFHFKL